MCNEIIRENIKSVKFISMRKCIENLIKTIYELNNSIIYKSEQPAIIVQQGK